MDSWGFLGILGDSWGFQKNKGILEDSAGSRLLEFSGFFGNLQTFLGILQDFPSLFKESMRFRESLDSI